MLTSDRPAHQINWLRTTLRWLFLAGFALAVALDPQRTQNLRFDFTSTGLLIGLAAFALVTLQISQALALWPRFAPTIGIIADASVALVLYAIYGGPSTPLLFIGLLPVADTALRYNATLAMVSAGVVIAGYIGVNAPFLTGNLIAGLLTLIANSVLIAISAVPITYFALRVRRSAQEVYQQQELTDKENYERNRERARAIYDMASTLSATLNYEKVLETALDVSEMGLSEFIPRGTRVVGLVLLFDDDLLQIVAARHLTRTDARATITGERGTFIGDALYSAEPVVTDSVTNDPDLRYVVALQDCKSIVCLPLRAGFENYGVMLFGCPIPDLFNEDQLELFTAVANQATIALQNARLYQSLLEEKERIIAVDEDARKKLARDLHDGPTQNVAAIAMRTNFTLRLIETEPARAAEEMRKIEELARQTAREMRHMLFTLRPLALESQGLTAALTQYCEKMHETYSLNVVLEARPFEHRVDAAKQGVTFYIIEEAVGNARKHAQSQHIWVRLSIRGDYFVVKIEDDGVGFDVPSVTNNYETRGSLGMVNMRERAALISGVTALESAPGKGTHVTVVVPLTDAAREELQALGGALPPLPQESALPPPAARNKSASTPNADKDKPRGPR